jgi:hypothetical protein
MLTRMLSKIGSLEGAVAAAEARRREMHNQLVELKGNVRGRLGGMAACLGRRAGTEASAGCMFGMMPCHMLLLTA